MVDQMWIVDVAEKKQEVGCILASNEITQKVYARSDFSFNTFFLPFTGGCSEGLGVFRFIFKHR